MLLPENRYADVGSDESQVPGCVVGTVEKPWQTGAEAWLPGIEERLNA
jgi:hypothetical protein